MKVNPDLKKDFDHIVDVFSGGDNITFMSFKMLVEHLDGKKDEESKKLLEMITRFAKLLRASRAMFDHARKEKK